MSHWFDTNTTPERQKILDQASPGPDVGFFGAVGAAYDQAFATRMSTSQGEMEDVARTERRTAIEEATGTSYNAAIKPFMGPGARALDFAGLAQESLTENAVDRLRASLPEDRRGGVLTKGEIEARAAELAFEAWATGQDARGRAYSGAAKLGLFLGEAGGAMRDPLNIASLAAGAPLAAGIIRFAVTEALIGGATEAAIQPFVQKWRKKIGAPYGLKQALSDVAFAALGAGVLAGGGKAAVNLARAVRGLKPAEIRQAFDEVVAKPTSEQRAARGLSEQEATGLSENPFEGDGALDTHVAAVAEAEAHVEAGTAPGPEGLNALKGTWDGPPAGYSVSPKIGETLAGQPEQLLREFETPAGAGQARDIAPMETDIRNAVDTGDDFEMPVGEVDGTLRTAKASEVLTEIDADRAFIDQLGVCVK